MSIVEIGAFAPLVGAIAILLSLVFVVIELRKNFRQNNIANTFHRATELDQLNLIQMDENMAKVLVKGYGSYYCLEAFEKVQIEGYVNQRIHIVTRAYRTADETAFTLGGDHVRGRMKNNLITFFSNPGMRECFHSMNKRNLIHSPDFVQTLVGEDVLAPPAG